MQELRTWNGRCDWNRAAVSSSTTTCSKGALLNAVPLTDHATVSLRCKGSDDRRDFALTVTRDPGVVPERWLDVSDREERGQGRAELT